MTEREAFEGWARKRWPLYEIYWFRDEPRRCMVGTDRGRNSDSLGAHYMGWRAAAARYGGVADALRGAAYELSCVPTYIKADRYDEAFRMVEAAQASVTTAIAALDGANG